MNKSIKVSIVLLIASCVSYLLSTYFDEMLDYDSIMLSFDALWLAVISWIIFYLIKKKNVTKTIFILAGICAVFTIFDCIEFGIRLPVYFNTAEILLFLCTGIILKRIDDTYWITDKS